jgi:hypothetical protein
MDEPPACRRRLDRFGLDKVPTPAHAAGDRDRGEQMRRSPSRTDDVVKMLPRREAALRLARLRNPGRMAGRKHRSERPSG